MDSLEEARVTARQVAAARLEADQKRLRELDDEREELRLRIRRNKRILAALSDVSPSRPEQTPVTKQEKAFVRDLLQEMPKGLRGSDVAEIARKRKFGPIRDAENPRIRAVAILRALRDDNLAYRTAGNIWRLLKEFR